ncbi:MAG: DNA-binding protein [Oscillospiraceae bacterium]|nr:DNA-binding protein [Oscillospiraceae bacterium]
MEGYLLAREIAQKWGISTRRVQLMCAEGRIEGVTRIGKTWVIPENAEKPNDARITTGEYRNWRKKKE